MITQNKFDISVTTEAPDDWDSWMLAQGHCYAGARQLSCRANIYDIEHEGKTYFLLCECDGAREAAVLASWIPSKRNSFLHRVLTRFLGVGNGVLEVFEGPVAKTNRHGEFSQLLAAVDKLAKDLRVSSIRISVIPFGYIKSKENFFADGMEAHGYIRHDWLTSVVNLEQGGGDAFQSLRRSERKAINKCVKAGVYLRKCETKSSFIHDFCEEYYSESWSEERLDRMERQWDLTDHQFYSYYVAVSKNEEILGVLGTYNFNGYITERLSKRTSVGKKSNLPVQDFLHWAIMECCRGAGDQWFDLAGFSPTPQSEGEKGIRFFKEKWGGELREAPFFLKDCRPSWLALLRKILPV